MKTQTNGHQLVLENNNLVDNLRQDTASLTFSQRTKQAHLQGTQSHRTKANLAKELALPPHDPTRQTTEETSTNA